MDKIFPFKRNEREVTACSFLMLYCLWCDIFNCILGVGIIVNGYGRGNTFNNSIFILHIKSIKFQIYTIWFVDSATYAEFYAQK